MLPIFLATSFEPLFAADLILDSKGNAQAVVSLDDPESLTQEDAPESLPPSDPFDNVSPLSSVAEAPEMAQLPPTVPPLPGRNLVDDFGDWRGTSNTTLSKNADDNLEVQADFNGVNHTVSVLKLPAINLGNIEGITVRFRVSSEQPLTLGFWGTGTYVYSGTKNEGFGLIGSNFGITVSGDNTWQEVVVPISRAGFSSVSLQSFGFSDGYVTAPYTIEISDVILPFQVVVKETFHPGGITKTRDEKHYDMQGRLVYQLAETFDRNRVLTLSQTTRISYHANGKVASKDFVKVSPTDGQRKSETFFETGLRDELKQEDTYYFKNTAVIQKQILTEMDNNQLTKLETRIYLASGALSTANLDNRTYHANGKSEARTLDVLTAAGIWTKQAWAWDDAGRVLVVDTRVFTATGILKTASLDHRTYHSNGKAATRTLDVLAATGIWTKQEWAWDDAGRALVINTRVFNANGSLKTASLDHRIYHANGKMAERTLDVLAATGVWTKQEWAWDSAARALVIDTRVFDANGALKTASLDHRSYHANGKAAERTLDTLAATGIWTKKEWTWNEAGKSLTIHTRVFNADGSLKSASLDSMQYYPTNKLLVRNLDTFASGAWKNVKTAYDEYGRAMPAQKAIFADPAKTEADVAQLTGINNLVVFASKPKATQATASLTQSSPSEFGVVFDVSKNNSYAGSITSFDDFGTTIVETRDLSHMQITLGASLSAGTGTIKVEIEDKKGKKDIAYLHGVNGSEQFFSFNADIFTKVDLTAIKNINFVIIEDFVTVKTAVLNLNVGDNPYAGPAFSPNPALDPNTVVPNSPSPLTGFTVGGAYDPSPSSGQSAETGVTVNITGGEPWGGVAVTYDDFSSTEIESIDLSASSSLTFVVQGNYPSLKLEIEDVDGNKAFIRLGGVTTAAQAWQIPLWAFKDVDFSRIRILVYVVEGAAQDGQITVKF
ncbi:MAG TPA: hypothetical protein DIS66_03095 [Candidatus Omnitrophica bacterium]|nr:hypothetical protein [Candidatus Omnitrophota bacterium]